MDPYAFGIVQIRTRNDTTIWEGLLRLGPVWSLFWLRWWGRGVGVPGVYKNGPDCDPGKNRAVLRYDQGGHDSTNFRAPLASQKEKLEYGTA